MKYQVYARHNFKKIPYYDRLTQNQIQAIHVVSEVLPFKTNNYVVNELIDWDNYRDDPLFILDQQPDPGNDFRPTHRRGGHGDQRGVHQTLQAGQRPRPE